MSNAKESKHIVTTLVAAMALLVLYFLTLCLIGLSVRFLIWFITL